MYLSVTPTLAWESDAVCSLTLADNPLARWVDLPEGLEALSFSNMVCGVLRGALEMVRLRVTCAFQADTLRGDSAASIRVELREVLSDETAEEYRAE